MPRTYQVCTRCVMDTTDPAIEFDEQGLCNHCRGYEQLAQRNLHHPEGELERVVAEIQARGRGKEYDCLIGVSGGVDSTYVAYMVKKLGLRPLAVHMDNGWDSELAVSNIEKFLKRLDIDLYTYVLDWEEFKDLQLAFLNASVSDAEVPTDHAIGGVMFQVAAERGISYIVSGTNTATEGILPSTWTYGVTDWRYISSVHRLFGKCRLRNYPHYTFFDMVYYAAVKRIQTVRILDYLPYNKGEALRVLQEELGWQYYGGKHYESIYTRFFQGYILPRKFNIDKRKAHLSTLICSGQISRDQALEELTQPTYPEKLQEEDRDYVIKKLELTEDEFNRIMALPLRTHAEFSTIESVHKTIKSLHLDTVARRLGFLPARQNAG